MDKLRFGIMGAGSIAHHFAGAVALTDCAKLVAAASKDPRRAAAFAEKHGIVGCTYEELLRRADIDAVYIATTHNFHYENIKACLAAGKHVLCEKAMVMHEWQAREVFALAKEKGLFLMEAMWSRFLPSIQRARKWICEGRIGAVQSVSGTIGFRCDGDRSHRILSRELGGGAMYDIGVYAAEITSFLVGEPVLDVIGSVRRDGRTGADTAVSFILKYPSADAALQCLVTANAMEHIIVNGDGGFIQIPTANVNDECFLYDGDRRLAEHFKEAFPQGNGFVYEIREMTDRIRRGEIFSPIMPPEATIECAWIFDRLLGTEETA